MSFFSELKRRNFVRMDGLVQAASDRLLDPLRDDPRFQKRMASSGHR